jgi:phage terminase small subunit
MIQLDPKHEEVVQEYMRCFSKKTALARCGYSKKGYALFHRADVQMRIAEIQQERNDFIKVHEGELLEQLQKIGFSDLTDFITWDENGVAIFDPEKVDGQVINEIDINQVTSTTASGDEVTKIKKKVKLHDKVSALKLLMQYKGMLQQNVNHTGGVNIQILDDIEVANDDQTK